MMLKLNIRKGKMVFKLMSNLSALDRTLSVSSLRSLFMAGATFLSLVVSSSANAILFNYDCGLCKGDTDFSFQIELAHSVVSANGSYSTGSDDGAGFLGFTASSSVGDGFSISGLYGDLLSINPSYVGFTFDDNGIIDGIWETDNVTNDPPFTGSGVILNFGNYEEGVIAWMESDWGGTVESITSYNPIGHDGGGMGGHWTIVEASIPEPSVTMLLASGLIAFGVVRRKARA